MLYMENKRFVWGKCSFCYKYNILDIVEAHLFSRICDNCILIKNGEWDIIKDEDWE